MRKDKRFGQNYGNIISLVNWVLSKKTAFTLAEMMVVLLIMSIVLAAMAPVMTTKMKADTKNLASPWRWIGSSPNAYFGNNDTGRAFIGQDNFTNDDDAKLVIRQTNGVNNHIMLKPTAEGGTTAKLFYDAANNILSLNTGANHPGQGSTAFGAGALNAGSENVAVGYQAASSNTTGSKNVAVGYQAAGNNTTGIGNVALGYQAVKDNTTGNNNTAVGYQAASSNTTGYNNTAVGYLASGKNTTGNENTALGYMASGKNTTGSNNTAVGNMALMANDTGSENIAIGNQANYTEEVTGFSNTIAIGNFSHATSDGTIAIGNSSQATSNGAIAIGNSSSAIAAANASGSGSIAIGGDTSASERDSIAIGGNTSASGRDSIAIKGTASDNSAIAINGTASSMDSIAIKGTASSTGSIAIGERSEATEYHSVAIGYSSEATGDSSLAIGGFSSGDGSVAIHGSASGGYSVAIGSGAHAANNGSIAIKGNTYGDSSIAIGEGANTEYNATGGIAIGYLAAARDHGVAMGYVARADNSNVAIGYYACNNVYGKNKICIGANSGPDSGHDWAKAYDTAERIFIGSKSKYNGAPAVLEVHNQELAESEELSGGDGKAKENLQSMVVINGSLLVKGSLYFKSFEADNDEIDYMRTYAQDNEVYHLASGDPYYSKLENYFGDLTTPSRYKKSDRRLKYVGTENKDGLDKIKQLKIFNYTFKKDDKKTPHVGVIAQDLQKIFPNAVSKGKDGFLLIRMEDMFYALVNAVKELDAKIEKIVQQVNNNSKILKQVQNDNKQLKKENAELKARLDKLEAKLK